MSERAVISTQSLDRSFGAVHAVDGLTLDVHAGETFGLLGHNGAGKTTTIRLLNGVLESHGGTTRVLGLDPRTDGHRVRAHTGVLTETPSLDERLSASENLRFYGRLYGVTGSELERRCAELLEAFALSDRANDRVVGFSRGMKQRVALARTLIHGPDILFLDEPTAALDPVAARQVHELIAGFRAHERRTVVICTHNLVEAQRLCDRVVILQQGRVLAIGTPDELARAAATHLRLEIHLEPRDAQAALALVTPLGLGTPSTDGDRLILEDVAREWIPRVVASLVQGGVSIYRVAHEEPTLEDAYFALHQDGRQRP